VLFCFAFLRFKKNRIKILWECFFVILFQGLFNVCVETKLLYKQTKSVCRKPKLFNEKSGFVESATKGLLES
jgi:hypothetical protein